MTTHAILEILGVDPELERRHASAVARADSDKPKVGDWPMWGGSADRNMVSDEKGFPYQWDAKTTCY